MVYQCCWIFVPMVRAENICSIHIICDILIYQD